MTPAQMGQTEDAVMTYMMRLPANQRTHQRVANEFSRRIAEIRITTSDNIAAAIDVARRLRREKVSDELFAAIKGLILIRIQTRIETSERTDDTGMENPDAYINFRTVQDMLNYEITNSLYRMHVNEEKKKEEERKKQQEEEAKKEAN
jgi:hypothetical protein